MVQIVKNHIPEAKNHIPRNVRTVAEAHSRSYYGGDRRLAEECSDCWECGPGPKIGEVPTPSDRQPRTQAA